MVTETHLGVEALSAAARVSAESVFSMMLGMEIEPMEPRSENEPNPYDGVVSLVTFTGEWLGAGMFCCHEDLACEIGAAMLGHQVTQVDSDVLDGIGEMANMIIGNLKEQLEAKTGPLSLSIPMVVYGKNFSTRTPVKAPWTIQPFQIGAHVLEVRCCARAV
jgi:chemotaxis protein CheX